MNPPAGRLRRNSAWQLLHTLLTTGVELLLLLVMAAALAPRQFGALAVALGAAKLIFLALEPRIQDFLIPRLSRYVARSGPTVWTWVRWSTVVEFACQGVALALALVLLPVVPYLRDQCGPEMLWAAAAYVWGHALFKFASLAVLRYLSALHVAVRQAALLAALKGLIAAAGLQQHWPVHWLFAGLALAAAMVAIVQACVTISCLRSAVGPPRWRPARPLRAAHRADILRILAGNYATGLVEMLHRELDLQLVAFIAGPIEAGRYRLAKTIALMTLEALNPVVLVLLPEMARLMAAGDGSSVARLLQRAQRVLAMLGLLATLCMLAFAFAYLSWIAPSQWSVWPALLVLACAFPLVAPWLWAQSYLVAAGRPWTYFRCSAFGASLAVLVALASIPPFGAAGAALGFGCGLVAATWLAAAAVVRMRRSPAAEGNRR